MLLESVCVCVCVRVCVAEGSSHVVQRQPSVIGWLPELMELIFKFQIDAFKVDEHKVDEHGFT